MKMRIGDSEVDFEAHVIDGPMGYQTMEPKIMKLLRVLTSHAGQVLTREDLITKVWGVEYGGDERLSRAISILRKALGDKRGDHRHILTISRVGYRFIAEVQESGPVTAIKPANLKAAASGQAQGDNALSNTSAIKTLSETLPPVISKPKGLMAKIAALIFACLAIGAFAFSGADRGKAELSLQAKMDRGFSHIDNFTAKGAINDAQDIFSTILSDDPSHAAARAGLAFALFREHTHLERDPATLQRAKSHAEAALRENEHLAIANVAVAWAAAFEGDLLRANRYLDRADILESKNKLALEGRYRIFIRQGQVDKALDVLSTAIERYPDHALFYASRGGLLLDNDDALSGEKDFRRALALQPDNPRTYAQLGHALYSQGRTVEAIDIIQDGLKVNETALLYNNLGTYLFFQGQYDLAVSAFEKTLEISGDTHDYLYWANLGDAYRWSNDKADQAATHYRRALQLLQIQMDRSPDDTNLKSRAAMFNAKLGELDKAQDIMNSFALTAESPSIQLYRAVVTYEILSNRAKALESLGAAIKADYPLIEILNDPELARLRQDRDYHRLLAETQKQ